MRKLFLIIFFVLLVPIAFANYWDRPLFWKDNGSIINLTRTRNIDISPQNFTADYLFGSWNGSSNYYTKAEVYPVGSLYNQTHINSIGNFTAWDKSYGDLIDEPTQLSNLTDNLGNRGYNCSVSNSCSNIIYLGNTSWILDTSWTNVTAGEWITPSYVLDIDDEDIESDLNTYVDIAGDTMTGDLNMGGTLNMSGNKIIEGGDISASGFSGVSAEDNVLYMRFDDISAEDSSPFEDNDGTLSGYTFNHGKVEGATLNTNDGKFGNAYDFDGVNDYIWLGQDIFTSAQIAKGTISAWVYFAQNETGNDAMVFDIEGMSNINVNRDDDLYPKASIYDGTGHEGKSNTTINLNTWTFLTSTWDGTTLRLYMDSVLVNSTPAGGPISSNFNRNVTIGSNFVFSSLFNGSIDEVRIWNKALTLSEIQAEMKASNPVKGDGLVSSYSFEFHNSSHTYDTNQIVNSSKSSDGKAYRFDGVNDRITITKDHSLENSDGTISFWFNPSVDFAAGSRNMGLVTKDDIYVGMYLNTADGKIKYIMYDGASHFISSTKNSWSKNTWYHVVGTWGSGGMNLSIDGAHDGTNNHTGSWTDTVDDWHIGDMNNDWFNGSIDEVAIFKRALGSDEIKNIYNRRKKYFTDDTSGHIGNYGVRGNITTIDGGKIEADGIIRTIPRSSSTCNSDSEGGIYYDSDDKTFYGCNSTDWRALY